MKVRNCNFLIVIIWLCLPQIPAEAQMVDGKNIPEFGQTFGVDAKRVTFDVEAYLFESSISGNVLWPDEQPVFVLQLVNHTKNEVAVDGDLLIISYGTKGILGDIWTPSMFKIADESSYPIVATIAPGAFVNIEIKAQLPSRLGAYGVVADLHQYGRQFITSCIRTFKSESKPLQYPSFCLDDISNKVLPRLGVQAIRYGVDYLPSTDPDFENWLDEHRQRLNGYKEANIAVLFKFGAAPRYHAVQVNSTPRPWLDKDGVMQNTKSDQSWMPEYDDDFKKVVEMIASEFGWPKGPINAIALWNEPWEGISISGWGADMPRYREIFTKMCEGVEAAREIAGVDVLTGGGSSTSNSLDKLFGDGSDEFLDRFDFFSIHYQGMESYATIKKFVNRNSERGRTRVWDTESWVANTDDRVASVVSTNKAAGYDRAMGIYKGNICHVIHQNVFQNDGTKAQKEVIHAWSVAASIGASQHFIGERKFKEIVFKKGLPWIYHFDGMHHNEDDGTLVIVGDIGEAFGANNVLFRTVRGLLEVNHKADLKKELAALSPDKDKDKIAAIKKALAEPMAFQQAAFTIDNSHNLFALYDFYGNEVAASQGVIHVPLDHRGFYLRSNGSEGSFKKLLMAVQNAHTTGIEPLEMIVRDMQSPVERNPDIRLSLTNVLNRPVKGRLSVRISGLTLKAPNTTLNFAAFETKEVLLKVENSFSVADNTYHVELLFDAGTDGIAVHEEDIHVNIISKRKITIDGNLEDWEGAFPQIIKPSGVSAPSLTEFAWQPFKKFDQDAAQGLATGYLAYDDQYFYFAAKVADETSDEGMIRVETRDDNQFYYPEKYFIPANGFSFGGAMKHPMLDFSIRWQGKLKPKFSGEYILTVINNDDATIWLNDKLLIQKRGNKLDEMTGKVFLKAGTLYDIRVEYSNTEWQNADSEIALYWESARQKREVIPAKAFFTAGSKSKNGLDATYFAGSEFNHLMSSKKDAQIKFKWKLKEVPCASFNDNKLIEYQWPEGVRRFSYRMDPEVPSGNFPNHDNIQIAFNVLHEEEKDMYAYPPGTMPGFIGYQCTDYEFALNPIAEKFGGGTEIYKIRVPGMPHKHHFPRQGKSTFDGPVQKGKMIALHEANTRIVEAAIPWSEIPHVKKKLDAGESIKFSFRVNDNGTEGCRELARDRSVSKINNSFRVDWKEHWANEVEFSFEK